jgi:hypothetical protein
MTEQRMSIVEMEEQNAPQQARAKAVQALREAVSRTLEHSPELRARTSAYGRAPGGRG